jgi:hypothetical protein
MTPAEREAYARLLKGVPLAIEFGCGGSTLIACKAGVPTIMSLDSDKAWLANIRNAPEFEPFLDRISLMHGDIGETREWGFPVRNPSREQAENYHSALWAFFGEVRPLACVFVDGRFRVACALQSLMHTSPGSFVCFHDYRERRHFHAVEQLVEPIERVDDMTVFQTPETFDREQAAALLEQHHRDPR